MYYLKYYIVAVTGIYKSLIYNKELDTAKYYPVNTCCEAYLIFDTWQNIHLHERSTIIWGGGVIPGAPARTLTPLIKLFHELYRDIAWLRNFPKVSVGSIITYIRIFFWSRVRCDLVLRCWSIIRLISVCRISPVISLNCPR